MGRAMQYSCQSLLILATTSTLVFTKAKTVRTEVQRIDQGIEVVLPAKAAETVGEQTGIASSFQKLLPRTLYLASETPD